MAPQSLLRHLKLNKNERNTSGNTIKKWGGVFYLRLVSVEPQLGTVKTYLEDCGYEVINMDTYHRGVEAVIYRGESIGYNKESKVVLLNTVLVNANGLTPEEVVTELESRLN